MCYGCVTLAFQYVFDLRFSNVISHTFQENFKPFTLHRLCFNCQHQCIDTCKKKCLNPKQHTCTNVCEKRCQYLKNVEFVVTTEITAPRSLVIALTQWIFFIYLFFKIWYLNLWIVFLPYNYYWQIKFQRKCEPEEKDRYQPFYNCGKIHLRIERIC